MYVRISVGPRPLPGRSLLGSLHQPPTAPAPPVTLAMRPPFAVFGGFAVDGAAVRGQLNERKADDVARHVVASWTGAQPVRTIRLVGHTDSTATAAYNVRLGARRAAAVSKKVRDAIERRSPGLSGKIAVVVASAGETRPVASNRSLSGRAQNRRVEVFLTTGAAAPVTPSPPTRRPGVPSPAEAARRVVPEPGPETPEEQVQRIVKTTIPQKAPGKPPGETTLARLDAEMASRGVPSSVRRAVLWVVRRGSGAILDQVLDAMGLSQQTKEAVRQSVRAALGRSW
jgi:hypothetical protein